MASDIVSAEELRERTIRKFGEEFVNTFETIMRKQAEDALVALRALGDHAANGTSQSVIPTLLVSGMKGGQEYTIAFGFACGFNTDLEKQIAMRQAAVSCREQSICPMAIGLLSEMWTVHLAPGERMGTLCVEDREDRRESIGVMIQTIDKSLTIASSVLVDRDGNNNIVKHAGDEWDRCDKAQARLLGMFWRAYLIESERRAEQK